MTHPDGFITRAEATGTITNSDPIPQAWLARFGRTAAEHVLDGVQARLSSPRNPGMQANVAGLWNLGTAADTRSDTLADTPADTALAAPGEAPQDGLRAHSDWIEGGLAGTDPGTSAALNLTARDLITGSAFAVTGETARRRVRSRVGPGRVFELLGAGQWRHPRRRVDHGDARGRLRLRALDRGGFAERQ